MAMQFQENVNLAQFSTFHIGGPAKFFIEVTTIDELKTALQFARKEQLPVFILGGGSNILISDQGFAGLVIKINNQGLEIAAADEATAKVTAAAGESWDELVEFAVAHDLWGIENLSLIPGQVGAAPVQNIGAYGQEVGDSIDSVTAWDQTTSKLKTLSASECGLAYRRSIFNSQARDRYIIWQLSLVLKKAGLPKLNYPDLSSWFNRLGHTPTLAEIRQRVIEVRQAKFADFKTIGSVGSFFKNLYLTAEQYQLLEKNIKKNFSPETLQRLQEIKNSFISEQGIKIPAAFIIDKVLDLKGTRLGGAQISPTQAVAIINPELKATAQDVLNLFKKVRQEAYKKTGLVLENEPTFVGFAETELQTYFELPKL